MKFLAYLALALVALFILARTALWIYYSNRDHQNPNIVEFINSSDLPTNDFRIVWSSGNESLTIFEFGKDTKKTFKEYGNNYFEVTLRDSVLAEFRQYKYNNWHGHHYTFYIQQLNDSLDVQLKIEGPDTRNFERTK